MIRRMNKEDIPDVVELYLNHMFDSVFVQLGRGFLTLIFKEMLKSDYATNYVYEDKSIIVGFISSSLNARRLFRQIINNNFFFLGYLIALKCITKPKTIFYIIDSASYFNKTELKSVNAELLFISIDPGYRRGGIAKELIAATLKEFCKRGISRVKVATLKNNLIVNNLLRKIGFIQVDIFKFFGKENVLYEFKLS